MKYIVKILFLLFMAESVSGQDAQFSQFYATPLYLCPSFAGATQGSRVALNYRNQWPAIPGAFVSYIGSFDQNIYGLNSGIGFMFFRDVAGSAKLSTTQLAAQYSYDIRASREWHVRPGIGFTYAERGIDFSKLILGDQVTLNGIAPSSREVPPFENVRYVDIASSVLVYSRIYWIGTSFDHLLKPNQTLFDGVESYIPLKSAVFGGVKKCINGRCGKYDEESISFAFNYKSQGKFDQVDLGAYWNKSSLIFGVWYRGIPGFKAYKKGYQNNDALILLVGYKLRDLSIGYSYDITISKLVISTGGSHEVSLIYLFNQNVKLHTKKKRLIVPCPKF